MDPAFIRRIRFMLDFPMPDAAMRCRLGNSRCRADYRAPDLDLGAFVDRFRLSGGSIQNISLAAAHMAAATPDGCITVSTWCVRHIVNSEIGPEPRPPELRSPGQLSPCGGCMSRITIDIGHVIVQTEAERVELEKATQAIREAFRVLGERLDRTPFGQFGEARTYARPAGAERPAA